MSAYHFALMRTETSPRFEVSTVATVVRFQSLGYQESVKLPEGRYERAQGSHRHIRKDPPDFILSTKINNNTAW